MAAESGDDHQAAAPEPQPAVLPTELAQGLRALTENHLYAQEQYIATFLRNTTGDSTLPSSVGSRSSKIHGARPRPSMQRMNSLGKSMGDAKGPADELAPEGEATDKVRSAKSTTQATEAATHEWLKSSMQLGNDKADASNELKRDDGSFQMRKKHREKQHILFQKCASYADQWSQIQEPSRVGFFARLVQNPRFDIMCAVVIILNGVLIVYNTNLAMQTLTDGADEASEVLELCFMSWYFLELSLKICVHGAYFFVNTDAAWNWMDFVLVALSLLDVAAQFARRSGAGVNMTFLRVVRLCKVSKVFRMFRALKFIRELRLMLDSLWGCMVTLFWSMLLLITLLGLFAIFFVQGFAVFLEESDTGRRERLVHSVMPAFGSVQKAMLTLFKCTSGGDDWSMYYKMVGYLGDLYMCVFVFFIIFFMIAVWNIVTSLFIDRAMKLAAPETEALMLEKERANEKDSEELERLCQEYGIDKNGDGSLNWEEFQECMSNESFRLYFDVRGINIRDTAMFFRMLSTANEYDGLVDIDTFVKGCMRMKGVASSIDLQTLSYEVKLMHFQMKSMAECFEAMHQSIKAASRDARAAVMAVSTLLRRVNQPAPPPVPVTQPVSRPPQPRSQEEVRYLPKVYQGVPVLIHEAGARYRVDNSCLKSATEGLALRFSKDLDHRDPARMARWGTSLEGTDEGDGWLQVRLSVMEAWRHAPKHETDGSTTKVPSNDMGDVMKDLEDLLESVGLHDVRPGAAHREQAVRLKGEDLHCMETDAEQEAPLRLQEDHRTGNMLLTGRRRVKWGLTLTEAKAIPQQDACIPHEDAQ